MLERLDAPLLSIDDLVVEFPGRNQLTRAVDGVSLKVQAGEIHGLVGESGAGKSTVGAAIMGLIGRPGRIAGGQIRFHGEAISNLEETAMAALRGKKISMIFQDPLTSLNPLFTVGQQLQETIETHLGLKSAASRVHAIERLVEVGIADPEIRINHYPHQFSGGMRQRVAIALALCSKPEIIIADEPTTALDVTIQAQILKLIKDLARKKQVGVILVTHDMGVIAETTDSVTVMYQGRFVESGKTGTVLRTPSHDYTKALMAAVPPSQTKLNRFPRVTYGGNRAEVHIDDLAKTWPKRTASRGRSLLQIDALTKSFASNRSLFPWRRTFFDAVSDVSFDIREGEIFGLVGESGSGKSTIARIIAGLHKPDRGQILFDGQEIAPSNAARKDPDMRRNIQMIFQDPFSSLNPRMRISEVIGEPAKHNKVLAGAELKRRVVDLLDAIGLDANAADRYPHEFSGGQRQRISIARALATEPRLLICDEPTSALDVSIQAQILNILKDLREHLGLTMLFISHDLPVIRQMCDRVGVLKNGRLVELAETEQLFAEPRHEYTRDLLDHIPRVDGFQS
ncbi:MAG: ABC transporter ATP-binding protein [Pseudomonadota bacterium]